MKSYNKSILHTTLLQCGNTFRMTRIASKIYKTLMTRPHLPLDPTQPTGINYSMRNDVPAYSKLGPIGSILEMDCMVCVTI